MSELVLNFDSKVKGLKYENIKIEAIPSINNKLKYRFFEGRSSVWTPITDFQEENKCMWRPSETGKFMIMVQAKEIESTKPFDYSALKSIQIKEVSIDDDEKKEIIKKVFLEKNNYLIGEKINIHVETSDEPTLIRMWRRGKSGFEPLKDYDLEKDFSYTATSEGREEILIECKDPNSQNDIDDFKMISFKIEKIHDIQIQDIKCVADNLVINEDLIFKVETNCDNKRSLLYKYYLADKEGNLKCIQDYSTYDFVSVKVKEKGDYKLFCFVRDIFSNSTFDDRAVINFYIKPYDPISIKRFYTDLKSPQLIETDINLKAKAIGGRQLLYRYIIQGETLEDTGYIKNKEFIWSPKEPGNYNITLNVKDISSQEEFEATETILYSIEKKGEKPVRLLDFIASRCTSSVINEPIKVTAKAEGGTALKYSFIVYKNGVEDEKVDFGNVNWVNFIPTEKGSYEVEVRVKDKYSKKDFDVNAFLAFDIKNYKPAKIDYMIKTSKEYYIVGDNIDIEAVCQNTSNVLLKFKTIINGREVEDTGFTKSKKLIFKPRCAGSYIIEAYAKSVDSDLDYDNKQRVKIEVYDAIPVHNTNIHSSVDKFNVNKEVTFTINSQGGKDVCYEFYIMEKSNWVKMQEYSKKNYYTFLPFTEGKYKLLVLCKSFYKKVNYEDYATMEFIVEKE